MLYLELLIERCGAVLIQARQIGGERQQLRAQRRLGDGIAKLELTFELGFGLLHTAHNPPSPTRSVHELEK